MLLAFAFAYGLIGRVIFLQNVLYFNFLCVLKNTTVAPVNGTTGVMASMSDSV